MPIQAPEQGEAVEIAPAMRGSNQAGMRAHNERLVLSLVRQHGPLSKSEIARITGLSAQTVSVIMRALETEGLLVKGEPVRGKVGQPSVPMGLAENGSYFFGLKIGRRSAELVLTNFLGTVIGRAQLTYRYPTPGNTVTFTHDAVTKLTGQLPPVDRPRIAGIGIAMPFQIWDWSKNIKVPESEMAAWRDIDIRAEIAAAYDYPVFLQNDASAACGAELVFGTKETPRDFLYFYIGYFIGGGVVLNGSLHTGRSGNAGALGSLPMPGRGRGEGVRQLIDVASLASLEAMLHEAELPTDGMWEPATGWAVPADLQSGWISDAARGIAYAVTVACSIIDFEAALIDGWIPAPVRDRLVAATLAEMKLLNLAGISPPEIAAGTIGPDARALGAASLPLSERFLVDRTAFL